MQNRKQSEAAQRSAERRKREDEAPRLSAEVPRLQSLVLEIEERRGGFVAGPKHVRRVVVQHAPALFILQCGDPRCKDGGHDITYAVLRCLHGGETQFDGEDACMGSVGSGNCALTMHFVGIATYE